MGAEYWVLVTNPRGGLNTSAHCILVLELLRKTQHGKTLDGIVLDSHKEAI